MRGMPVYRRLATPLHAARATIGATWTLALIAAALCIDNPLLLLALTLAALLAGAASEVGPQLARSLRVAVIVALPIVLGNLVVSRGGLTVFARLGDLGPFGQGNLTVEALVYGVVIALKVTIAMLATTLASLAVDPDELLRAARRLSFRSAITASLATRMVPVLARDAARFAEAQRTRGDWHEQSAKKRRSRGGGDRVRARVRLLSAIVGSSLDRAMDVAATLELRGFASAQATPRQREPWSRHDVAFATSAAALVALAILARASALAPFSAYPQIRLSAGLAAIGLGVALLAAGLAPFADRKGVAL